ncbi:MAG TPA: GNAT family N-acetyltransferase [Ktedonobacteraceae bacterium]
MMLSGPIIVREVTAEDIPFVRAMIWEAIVASPTLVAQDGIETMQQYEEHYWRGWMEHPDPAFVALDATGCKLGAITIKPNDTGEPVGGWRIGIGVEAYARGQGVGQRLIARAIAFAREKSATYVNLFVDPMNIQAIALYQRLGFVEVGKMGGLIEMRVSL